MAVHMQKIGRFIFILFSKMSYRLLQKYTILFLQVNFTMRDTPFTPVSFPLPFPEKGCWIWDSLQTHHEGFRNLHRMIRPVQKNMEQNQNRPKSDTGETQYLPRYRYRKLITHRLSD